ncbi:MAG: response regulator [Phycisphaerales bacterium]|nr:response regulator [Phycisphaerales bacterium]
MSDLKNNHHPTRFLIVEDDDDHAELIKLSMELSGGNSVFDRVSDGAEALEFLKQHGVHKDSPLPDVILLDLNMPKVNGHQVIESVKADNKLKLIPIVVMTTSNAQQDRIRAYESAVNGYVIKPVNFDQFKELVCDLEKFWSEWNQPPYDKSA